MAATYPISITVDAKDHASGAIAGIARKIKGSFGGISFGDIAGGAALGNAISGIASRAVAQVKQLAMDAVAAGSEVADGSRRLGMSAKDYQTFTHAAKLAGVEAGQFEAAARTLQDRLSSPAGAAALAKLGVNIQSLKGMQPAELFRTVAGALAGVQDNVLKTGLAMDLFGKSGTALFPLLGDSVQAFNANLDTASKSAIIMSDATVKAMDDIGDALDTVKQNATALTAEFLASGLDAMNENSQTLLQTWEIMSAIVGGVARIVWDIVKGLADGVSQIGSLIGWVAGNMEELDHNIRLLQYPAKLLAGEEFKPLAPMPDFKMPIIDTVKNIGDDIRSMIEEVRNSTGEFMAGELGRGKKAGGAGGGGQTGAGFTPPSGAGGGAVDWNPLIWGAAQDVDSMKRGWADIKAGWRGVGENLLNAGARSLKDMVAPGTERPQFAGAASFMSSEWASAMARAQTKDARTSAQEQANGLLTGVRDGVNKLCGLFAKLVPDE